MGDFFEPDVDSVSTLSPAQQGVQGFLPGVFESTLSPQLLSQRNTALSQLLSGTPTDFTNIRQAALRRFDQDVVPRINERFAALGGSLSSRAATETRTSLDNLQATLGTLQTGLIESARQRQLGAVQAALSPLGAATAFGTQSTVENLVQPSPFTQLLGAGTSLGSAALLGGKGG